MNGIPELELSPADSNSLADARSTFVDLDALEAEVLARLPLPAAPLLALDGFRRAALDRWKTCDHFVVRGVPPADDGSTALLLASLLFGALRPYREKHLVKCFRMSPWTTALSHTLADGSFHTDLNTAKHPPAATLMQCIHPDPDAPRHGQLRVARFRELVDALAEAGEQRAVRLLTTERVVMVNDASSDRWMGTVQDGGVVRFHPETLRAGHRRFGTDPGDLDTVLHIIHQAALEVSTPIDLGPGDVLAVANHRALHQRGACTVVFRSFPRDFESRSVAVLHAMNEIE